MDYHALKRLLTQLFSSDAELLEIGDIVDIILEENHVGTTVKVDGQQSDPYAILSTINIHQYKVRNKPSLTFIDFSGTKSSVQDNKGIKSLYKYLLGKCPKKDEKLQKAVQNILSPDSDKHVGWVVSERFINMPMEIMPPMYAMMKDEIQAAIKKVRHIQLTIWTDRKPDTCRKSHIRSNGTCLSQRHTKKSLRPSMKKMRMGKTSNHRLRRSRRRQVTRTRG